MTTMLEKAAMAAADNVPLNSGDMSPDWECCIDLARAVLMAVREPGADAVQAGMTATGFNWGVSHSSWQAMIDAILSETP